ncbi:MAG: exodeoxyribonuclease V subunit alpha, partial [Burkholderiales bacterium]|nr:exodeoxyribonuclease V subunit alpha [Burkholderiales bacterium]
KSVGSDISVGLTGLDISLANYFNSQQVSDDPRHLWLAALTSYQWGRGHACLDLNALQFQACALLGWNDEQVTALPKHLSAAAPTLPWIQGDNSPLVLVQDTQGECLYLRRAWNAEQSIREHILQRINLPIAEPVDLRLQLDALFGTETSMQRIACEVAAKNRITLITGGPGTGKTTTVVKLLALLIATSINDLKIHLAAPTGKAAARLTESITNALAQMPADVQSRIPTQTQTLHRLLRSNSRDTRVHPLATDVVVVDEASMVDLEMMARLLASVPPTARLILLGDKDQLASVEAGAVMSQLCTGELLRAQTVTLTHSHRFDAASGIGKWAQAVNADNQKNATSIQALWNAAPDWLSTFPNNTSEDSNQDSGQTDPLHQVTKLQLQNPHDAKLAQALAFGWRHWLSLLDSHRTNTFKKITACTDSQAIDLLKSFNEFSVLCAVREGPFGVTQLNAHIEKALGFTASAWYVGRPVMVTRNDYALELMNGDVGICLPGADGVLRVAFPSLGSNVRWIVPSRLDAVETVFAMTVHKSQGSEFHHVLFVVPAHDSPVLTRELVYTGLTRAKENLTLWAPRPEVLLQACNRRILRSGGLGAG